MDFAATRKLKSQEGELFEVEENTLKMSKFFKDLMNDYPDPDQEIMVNQIKSRHLKKIIDYLKHYENEKPKEIKKPLPSGDLKEVLQDWDYNFINPLSLEECIDILNGAFFLDINELVDLCSAKIASEMLTGTVEEVREKFEWKNMTDEEKKEYGIDFETMENTETDENVEQNEIKGNKNEIIENDEKNEIKENEEKNEIKENIEKSDKNETNKDDEK